MKKQNTLNFRLAVFWRQSKKMCIISHNSYFFLRANCQKWFLTRSKKKYRIADFWGVIFTCWKKNPSNFLLISFKHFSSNWKLSGDISSPDILHLKNPLFIRLYFSNPRSEGKQKRKEKEKKGIKWTSLLSWKNC